MKEVQYAEQEGGSSQESAVSRCGPRTKGEKEASASDSSSADWDTSSSEESSSSACGDEESRSACGSEAADGGKEGKSRKKLTQRKAGVKKANKSRKSATVTVENNKERSRVVWTEPMVSTYFIIMIYCTESLQI